MKKITRTIAGLLLAIQLNAQSDTTSLMIRGKCTYQFDYKTNERLEEFDTCYNSFYMCIINLSPYTILSI